MKFTKMQGAGNDYIFINTFDEAVGSINDVKELSKKLSRRHFSVGSDGIILIMPSDIADVRMRVFNADGSEAEMCGNGARCVAMYAYERGLVASKTMTLETLGGTRCVEIGRNNMVTVDMGAPKFDAKRVPLSTNAARVVDRETSILGLKLRMTCVSMGNPHAVMFTDIDPFEMADFPRYGRPLENDPLFPERANIEFVRILSDNHIKMRVWERGSGETLACGTGACASAVASILTGRVGGKCVRVSLRGGDLHIRWNGEGESVYMTGDAVFVYDGELMGER